MQYLLKALWLFAFLFLVEGEAWSHPQMKSQTIPRISNYMSPSNSYEKAFQIFPTRHPVWIFRDQYFDAQEISQAARNILSIESEVKDRFREISDDPKVVDLLNKPFHIIVDKNLLIEESHAAFFHPQYQDFFGLNAIVVRPSILTHPAEFRLAMIHEYQHLIHYHFNKDESIWLNEMLSKLAEFILTGSFPDHGIREFLHGNRKTISLKKWDYQNLNASYSTVLLFGVYLYSHYYSDEFFDFFWKDKAQSIHSIDNYLSKFDMSFDKVWSDFSLALALNNQLEMPQSFQLANEWMAPYLYDHYMRPDVMPLYSYKKDDKNKVRATVPIEALQTSYHKVPNPVTKVTTSCSSGPSDSDVKIYLVYQSSKETFVYLATNSHTSVPENFKKSLPIIIIVNPTLDHQTCNFQFEL